MRLDGFKELSTKQQEFVKNNYYLIQAFLERDSQASILSIEAKEDLLSYLHLSICSSAMKFEEERGFKPSTYIWGGFSLALSHYFEDKKRERRLLTIEYEENSEIVEKYINKKCKYIASEKIYDLICKVDLKDIERRIVDMYYGESNLSYFEISQKIGMSKENVRKIMNKAISKIRFYIISCGIGISDFIT